MALNTFQEVRDFLNDVLRRNGQAGDMDNAPHRAFWDTLSYEQFVNGNVPGVVDAGKPLRILVPGDSAASNLVEALRGTGIFNANTGSQDRMPASGPPYFTDAEIAEIAGWIDAGCPR